MYNTIFNIRYNIHCNVFYFTILNIYNTPIQYNIIIHKIMHIIKIKTHRYRRYRLANCKQMGYRGGEVGIPPLTHPQRHCHSALAGGPGFGLWQRLVKGDVGS